LPYFPPYYKFFSFEWSQSRDARAISIALLFFTHLSGALAEKDITTDRLQIDRLAPAAVQVRIHRTAADPPAPAVDFSQIEIRIHGAADRPHAQRHRSLRRHRQVDIAADGMRPDLRRIPGDDN